MRTPSYDSYFDPPAEDWGRCPKCDSTQEDAKLIDHGAFAHTYICPCGREYTDDEAHPDPREMRDEMRMREAGL